MRKMQPLCFRATKTEKRILDEASQALGQTRSRLVKSAAMALAKEILSLKPA
jgi:uncharacterized protein (DUF1778 family)